MLDQVELAWRLRRKGKRTCMCLVGVLAAETSMLLQFASASHRGRAAWSSGGCRATASLLDQVELAWRLRRKGKHTCMCLVGVLAAETGTHLQSVSASHYEGAASLLDQVELAWRLRRKGKHTCMCLVGVLAAETGTHLQSVSASHYEGAASLLDQVELAWRLRRHGKHTCMCLVGVLAAVMSTHLQSTSASHRGRAAWSSGACMAAPSHKQAHLHVPGWSACGKDGHAPSIRLRFASKSSRKLARSGGACIAALPRQAHLQVPCWSACGSERRGCITS